MYYNAEKSLNICQFSLPSVLAEVNNFVSFFSEKFSVKVMSTIYYNLLLKCKYF